MTTLVEADRPFPTPWWITPHGLTLGFLIPVLLLVAAAGRLSFPGLTGRGHVFLNDGHVLMAIVILICIAVGGWIGTRITPTHDAPAMDGYLRAGFLIGL